MVFSWFIFGALIFHAQALVCDGSAYILEFLTFNKGPIVFLMSLYLEQASKEPDASHPLVPLCF